VGQFLGQIGVEGRAGGSVPLKPAQVPSEPHDDAKADHHGQLVPQRAPESGIGENLSRYQFLVGGSEVRQLGIDRQVLLLIDPACSLASSLSKNFLGSFDEPSSSFVLLIPDPPGSA